MYKTGLLFDRTPEERKDPFLSWRREDQPFFAAGACHILAEMFLQLHQGENFSMIYIKPHKGFPGNHVYASNGTWAFDHNGWTKEHELLDAVELAYTTKYPGWKYERITIELGISSLEKFCKMNHHRLPWQYPYLPWERAYNYTKQFPETHPS
jgi:hypothetical protein